jgi:hypothetical protein
MTRARVALLIALAVGGCSKPRTEAVALITTSGLRIPIDIDGLAVRVASRAPGASDDELFNKTYQMCHDGLTEACLTLPATLTLFPGKSRPNDSVRVVIEATVRGTPALASAATFTFSEGQSLRLDFVLYANCIGKLDCAARDEICNQQGMCEKLVPRPFEGELDLGAIDMTSGGPGPDLAGPDLLIPADLSTVDLATTDGPCGNSAGPCCPSGSPCNLALLACSPQNTCVACGAVGNPCCGGSLCPTSGICNGTTCVTCGGVGQPCCGGGQCASGGTCSGGTCQCGAVGQSCCQPANSCPTSGTCSGAGGTCMGMTCGGSTQVCCTGNLCNSGFTCSTGFCVPCGGQGQGCCAGTTCDPNLLCVAGTSCQPCGDFNQSCCPGSLCNNGGLACAANNLCQSCGNRGEICCMGAMCNEGVCDGTNHCQCGAVGQACCNGSCPISGECDTGMDRCEFVDMAEPPDMAMPEDMTADDDMAIPPIDSGGELGLE